MATAGAGFRRYLTEAQSGSPSWKDGCPAIRLGGKRPEAGDREEAMLILTRKVDQGIIISGNILVRVLGVERDRVKIGISAPGDVTVLRQELWHDAETPWEQHKDRNPAPTSNNGNGPTAAAS